ncbi:CFEM domain-containing protein [Purpureocillium lavendulum]|uniref:CFEM domain-containing protein n=1 Tax=Purpureocillium lavendulum TaxID=1247861 RepID=A0AB34FSB4_9HYPO|nr:CFEM domain-containing protein [Purpureocillium lavendulum]
MPLIIHPTKLMATIMAIVMGLTAVMALEQCATLTKSTQEDCLSAFVRSGSARPCGAVDTACQCRDANFMTFMPCCLFDGCSSRAHAVAAAGVAKACEDADAPLAADDGDWECMPTLTGRTSSTSVPEVPTVVLPTRDAPQSVRLTGARSTTMTMVTTKVTTKVTTTTMAMKTTSTASPTTDKGKASMTGDKSRASTADQDDETSLGPSALTVGLGVGLGVGLPLLVALAGFAHIVRLTRRHAREDATADEPSYTSDKMAGEATAAEMDGTHGPSELGGGEATHYKKPADAAPVFYAELP